MGTVRNEMVKSKVNLTVVFAVAVSGGGGRGIDLLRSPRQGCDPVSFILFRDKQFVCRLGTADGNRWL